MNTVYRVGLACNDPKSALPLFKNFSSLRPVKNAGQGDLLLYDGTGVFPATPKARAILVNSDRAYRVAVDRSVMLISCGMSLRSTVTASSLEKNAFCLGVQRRLTAFDGTVIEPQEIKITTARQYPLFFMMAVTVAAMLSGEPLFESKILT